MLKRNKFLIIFLALLITCMSVAVAADVNDSTATVTTDISTTAGDVNMADVQKVTNAEDNNKLVKDNNKITKNNNIKSDEQPITISSESEFDDMFSSISTNTYQIKSDYSGKVIKINTDITKSSNSYIINVPINLTSDNNNTINLNTINGYNLPTSNPTYIEFNNGASNSNISYLHFHNTQVFTTTATNVTFDHINVTVDNQGVGKSTGVFSMRNGVINTTVKNSYFNVTENTGCSIIVITLGENCTIENNTIIGQGTVGNLVYLNMWGATTNSNGITQNKGNLIKDNTITGPSTPSSICMAIAVGGPNNQIINNTINYAGTGINNNWAGTYDPLTNTTDDYYNITYNGNAFINNTLNNGATFTASQRSFVAGNYITGTATIAKNSTVTNNTFLSTVKLNGYTNFVQNLVTGLLNVSGSYNNVSLNNMADITIPSTSSNNNVSNNNFNNLDIYSDDNVITYNNYTGDISEHGALDNTILNNNYVSALANINSNSKNLKTEPQIIEITSENKDTYIKVQDDTEISPNSNVPGGSTVIFKENLKDLFPNAKILYSGNILHKNNTVYISTAPGVVIKDVRVWMYNGAISLANATLEYTAKYEDDLYAIVTEVAKKPYSYVIDNITLNYHKETGEFGGAMFIGNNYSFTLKNSIINSYIPASQVNWDGTGDSPSNLPIAYTIYMPSNSKNVVISNNTINTYELTNDASPNPTIFAIANQGNDNTITGNNLTLNGQHWMYNVVSQYTHNTTITNNIITTNSTNYSAGVYLSGANMYDNVIDGNIINTMAGYDKERDETTGSPEYVSYGVVFENRAYMGGDHSYGEGNFVRNTISNNTLLGSAYNIYGVEIFGADGSIVENNNVNISGNTTLGLGAIGANTSFNNNTISIDGLREAGSTVDYLGAGTTGILILRSSDSTATNNTITSTFNGVTVQISKNSVVENNNLTSTEEYTIKIKNSNNTNVTNNYLVAKELKGDSSVLDTNGNDNIIENNLPLAPKEYSLKVDTTEFTVATKATISASLYLGEDVASDINKGKVVFKVNGKTLKDVNGKVIYAKVVNGTATIADYEIPESWTKENTTIEAVLTGCTQTGKLKTEKTPINVTTQETTITTTDATATAGSTITLNATINSSTQVTGKVVFKVNGKTVKDANGKVIYAKVVNNTVSVEYTLPESMKAGSYNITAVLISSTQDKLEDVKTLTVA